MEATSLNSAVAISLFLVLTALGALHFYWALGGFWPGRDQRSLMRIVWGVEGARGRIPPALTAAVGLALSTAGIVPIVHTGLIASPISAHRIGLVLLPVAMAAAACVFAVRGLAGYVPAWRKIMSGEPFATLDVRFYSPLCSAIAVGFIILLL